MSPHWAQHRYPQGKASGRAERQGQPGAGGAGVTGPVKGTPCDPMATGLWEETTMAKPATGQRGAESPPPAPQQRPLLKATQLHGARPDCGPVWGEREPLRDEYAESNTSVEARPPQR